MITSILIVIGIFFITSQLGAIGDILFLIAMFYFFGFTGLFIAIAIALVTLANAAGNQA
jgi:hypothetical protein